MIKSATWPAYLVYKCHYIATQRCIYLFKTIIVFYLLTMWCVSNLDCVRNVSQLDSDFPILASGHACGYRHLLGCLWLDGPKQTHSHIWSWYWLSAGPLSTLNFIIKEISLGFLTCQLQHHKRWEKKLQGLLRATLELAWHNFCCILLVKASHKCTNIQGVRKEMLSIDGRNSYTAEYAKTYIAKGMHSVVGIIFVVIFANSLLYPDAAVMQN